MSNANILQNNLRQITDLLDNMISTEERNLVRLMQTSDRTRHSRQMTLRLERLNSRLERISQLLNAYLAIVLYQRPPQIQSRRIQQAYRLFRNSNIWQDYPQIVENEHQRLTDLSNRLDDLQIRVPHIIFHLRRHLS